MARDLKKHPNHVRLGFRVEFQFFMVCPKNDDPQTCWSRLLHPSVLELHGGLRAKIGPTIPPHDAVHSKAIFDSQWQIRCGPHRLAEAEENLVPEQYQTMPLAIMSPIFNFSQRRWPDIIQQLLEFFHEFAEKHSCRMFCNENTALHVQVGLLSSGQAMPLKTAKNLLRIVTAFEKYFDTLHPISRIHSDRLLCRPPAHFFQLVPGLGGKSPIEYLEKIDGFEKHEHIQAVFSLLETNMDASATNCCALNLNNLSSQRDHRLPKVWIEFRQHVGTLDFEEVINWIDLCCFLRLRAEQNQCIGEQEFISQAIKESLANEDAEFPLLRYLDMPESVIKFYNSKLVLEEDAEVGKFHPYSLERRVSAINAENSSSPFFPLVDQVSLRRYLDENYVEVRKAIKERRRRGGYGRLDATQALQGRRLRRDNEARCAEPRHLYLEMEPLSLDEDEDAMDWTADDTFINWE